MDKGLLECFCYYSDNTSLLSKASVSFISNLSLSRGLTSLNWKHLCRHFNMTRSGILKSVATDVRQCNSLLWFNVPSKTCLTHIFFQSQGKLWQQESNQSLVYSQLAARRERTEPFVYRSKSFRNKHFTLLPFATLICSNVQKMWATFCRGLRVSHGSNLGVSICVQDRDLPEQYKLRLCQQRRQLVSQTEKH